MPQDRLLQQLAEIVDNKYWPTSEHFDRTEIVKGDRFSPLSELGLFGMAVPEDSGGLGLDPAVNRQVLRSLAGGCGATAFMFAQHHGCAGALARTSNAALQERWLAKVVDQTLAGTAYAHVRRAGPPVIAATPAGPGRWTFSGEAPWATSWGVASVYCVAAVSPDGEIVWGLFEQGHEGVSAPAPLNLMVFGNTGTVRLRFDEAVVDESNLLSVASLSEWQAKDQFLVARPSPLAMGVGDRTFSLLDDFAPKVADEHRAAWQAAVERADSVCAAVDAIIDPSDAGIEVDEVADARAEVILTVQRLTTVLMSVLGGRASELSQPAQRLAREALFYIVQGQDENGRQALLRATA